MNTAQFFNYLFIINMNTLNIFDLQIPMSIDKEIGENLGRIDRNLNQLNKDYDLIKSFEQQLGTNMSIDNMIVGLKEYESCENNMNRYKHINEFIQLYEDCNRLERFEREVIIV